jgi:lipoprotein-anchoring transpeptidase ErfK/SrfK
MNDSVAIVERHLSTRWHRRAPNINKLIGVVGATVVLAIALLWTASTRAQLLVMAPDGNSGSIFPEVFLNRSVTEETARLQRQLINYPSHEVPGTIIIDTPNTYLYLILGQGQAIRYGIGVGREGFTWSGVKQVASKTEWPDWYPPAMMINRQPYLPRMVAGGPGNPLGARAMYIGGTEYRIHGTNDPTTIGKQVSSGCIRLTNDNVVDLYNRVKIGAKVIVLPMDQRHMTQARRVSSAPPSRGAMRLRSQNIY